MFHRSRVSPTVHVHEGESSHDALSSRGGIVRTLLKMGLFFVLGEFNVASMPVIVRDEQN